MNRDIIKLREEAKILLPEILQFLLTTISSDISFIRCRVKSVDSINKKWINSKLIFQVFMTLLAFAL